VHDRRPRSVAHWKQRRVDANGHARVIRFFTRLAIADIFSCSGNGGSSVLLEGYVYKVSVLQQLLTDQRLRLLQMRKLPLVLDLDDTILRAVGDEGVKKVSERDAQSGIFIFCPKPIGPHLAFMCAEELRGRVRHLSRRNYTVVLADGLDQFLSWASEKFEISLCSLGEKDYVDAVYEELNKSGPRVVGLAYSARFIYDFYHRYESYQINVFFLKKNKGIMISSNP